MMEWVEFTAKTVDDALKDALIKLGKSSDNVEYEIIEKESNGIFLGLFSKPAKIRVREKHSVPNVAKSFLERILHAMNIQAEIEIEYDEADGVMEIDLSGEDMGVLIGKRGQTLDSLQYLTSLVINKESDRYLKVKLDTENYRERRRETLENLAKNLAYKVKRTKKQVVLEPMNPYERRIIHSALQYDKFVETHSEGDEPYRKVVITMKKNTKTARTNNQYKSYNNGYKERKNVNTVVD